MPYPETPGHKTPGTSADSAKRMVGVAEILRLKALALLKREAMTADELATALNETPFSIRPRVSELKRLGQIVATGARRPNTSGHMASVWRANP
jgi:DNA-binding transcriptional ArsR family regulator